MLSTHPHPLADVQHMYMYVATCTCLHTCMYPTCIHVHTCMLGYTHSGLPHWIQQQVIRRGIWVLSCMGNTRSGAGQDYTSHNNMLSQCHVLISVPGLDRITIIYIPYCCPNCHVLISVPGLDRITIIHLPY